MKLAYGSHPVGLTSSARDGSADAQSEVERLAALKLYEIIDTPPEETFDRITRLAVAATGVSVARITFIDQTREWIKSATGPYRPECPRENSFGDAVMARNGLFVIENLAEDARFSAHPWVTESPHLRFYAGVPVRVAHGHAIAVLCLLDLQPRPQPPSWSQLLLDLAAMVTDALEFRRQLRHREAEEVRLRASYHALYANEARTLEASVLIRAVVENSPDPIFVKDIAGRYLLLNESCAQAIGFSRAQILGRTDGELLPLEVSAPLRAVDENVAAIGHTVTVEEIIPSPNGIKTFLTTKAPLIDAAGTMVGVVGIARDITARKQAEEALRAAKDEACAANRAKSNFLSAMSHDLRTPLNAVLGFSQMLEISTKDPLTPTQQKCVTHIHHAGQHLLDLINEILDLAKIESGRLNLIMESVDLRSALCESLTLVTPLGSPRGITVQVQEQAGPAPQVWADATRLKQVLVNLLSNAMKYNCQDGLVTITESAAPDEDGAPARLRLTITDTGVGMPPDRLHQLFRPFERLGAEITDIEGTGIGLTITRQLVLLMKGRIGVSSRIGDGSSFWVELPLAESPPLNDTAADAPPYPSS